MTDVFISYKRRLRPRVEEIAGALRALKLTVWFDSALEAGVSFSAEISKEVRTAQVVLVCWSDDAFPHGGDTSGWVVGEASIGRERGRLVPVLLAATELDPPWNTLHTESLADWRAGDFGSDRSGWRNVLRAIGKLTGRPGLAEYDEALETGTPEALAAWQQDYPDDPLALDSRPVTLTSSAFMPAGPQVMIAGWTGAVVTAIGAALLAGIDPNLNSGWWAIVGGLVLFGLPLAGLFWRAGVIGPWRAAGLVAAIVAAFGVGWMAALLAVIPMRGWGPAAYDLEEAVVCGVAGLLGAVLSLGAFPLLGLAPKAPATLLKIGAAGLLLGAIAAFVALLPFFHLEVWNSAVIWLAAVWELCYAPLLVWVLRPRQGAAIR